MENPWLELPKKQPYVLDQDSRIINQYNEKYGDTISKIQTHLLPDPYVGNTAAPIIILTKNPGYDQLHDTYWHSRNDFHQIIRDNIEQKPSEFPFAYFNPQIKGCPGNTWHKQKMKWLIADTSLKVVTQNVCSIPLFPYHCSSLKSIPKSITKDILPSQYFTQYILQQAIKRDALIIFMMAKSLWLKLVPELEKYPKCYKVKNPQTPVISPNNLLEYSELVDCLSLISELPPK